MFSTHNRNAVAKKKKEKSAKESSRIEKWKKMLPTLETMLKKKNKKCNYFIPLSLIMIQ
jgi:hypothetical protein